MLGSPADEIVDQAGVHDRGETAARVVAQQPFGIRFLVQEMAHDAPASVFAARKFRQKCPNVGISEIDTTHDRRR